MDKPFTLLCALSRRVWEGEAKGLISSYRKVFDALGCSRSSKKFIRKTAIKLGSLTNVVGTNCINLSKIVKICKYLLLS